MELLPNKYFEQKTLKAARNLVGKYLVRKVGRRIIREKITEVEAYVGPHDLACHSARGRSARTEVMYKQAGTIYVYLIYGIYFMLNIVTEEPNYPAAILIRSTENFKGPGVLTRELKIDKKLNGKLLGKESGLWIESEANEAKKLKANKLISTPRIGVNYAGDKWANKPYRFLLRE